MKKPEIIYHKGQKIIYIEFEGLKTVEEFAYILQHSKDYIRNQPHNSVYGLANMNGMHFNKDVRDLITEFIGGNKVFMKRSASYGVGGLLRIVYNGVIKLTGRDVRVFETKQGALEWLVANQEVVA